MINHCHQKNRILITAKLYPTRCRQSPVIFFSILGTVPVPVLLGKNSLIFPSIGKISDIYLKTSKNGKNVMISVTVICFLKVNKIGLGHMKISIIPCHKYQIN